MASLFKRRATAASSDLKHLSESETALAQSSFNVEKITEIQNRFTGGEMLLVPGRIFIREGMLWKSCRKGLKKRQFFLFNDVLVYGSIVARGRYSNQHVLTLSVMTVESECHYQPSLNEGVSLGQGELEPENAFQVNHTNKSFHVVAQSRADKANWLSNLQKQIKKVTVGGSGGRQAVLKAVWVPDSACKECSLCKQRFTAFVRKHHCRMCGRVVCSSCSPHKADISRLLRAEATGKLERVCLTCFKSTSPSSSTGEVNPTVTHSEDSTAVGAGEEEQSDSSETEDSDDSEVETTPVPPPRRKKQQKQREEEEQRRREEEEQQRREEEEQRQREEEEQRRREEEEQRHKEEDGQEKHQEEKHQEQPAVQQQEEGQQLQARQETVVVSDSSIQLVKEAVVCQQAPAGPDAAEQLRPKDMPGESEVKGTEQTLTARRRRQKYQSEEESGTGTNTGTKIGDVTGEEAVSDLSRSSRSPSAHVRLRKSKFTTPSPAAENTMTN